MIMNRSTRRILQVLFGVKLTETRYESAVESVWEREYTRTDEINFAQIFSSRLTNYAIADSTITAEDEEIDDVLQETIYRARKWIPMGIGVGRVYLVPFINGGKLYTDIIPQSRVYVCNSIGGDIREIVVLADIRVIENRRYYRYTHYAFNPTSRTFSIRNKAASHGGNVVPMHIIAEWADIDDEIVLNGVDRPLFAVFDSPRDSSLPDISQGVSLLNGCEKTVTEIRDLLKQYAREYELKRAFVGVDKLMVDPETGKPSDLFQTFEGKTTDNLFEVFSPAIRDASYRDRFRDLCGLLEKQVGTSAGILTPSETVGATATQVRRSLYDTWSLVSRIRHNIERCLDDLCECYAVYLRLLGHGAIADATVSYDWDCSMIEDSGETFSQLMQAYTIGAISAAEVRQWLKPSESADEAQKAVEAIAATKPENPFGDDIGL